MSSQPQQGSKSRTGAVWRFARLSGQSMEQHGPVRLLAALRVRGGISSGLSVFHPGDCQTAHSQAGLLCALGLLRCQIS